MKKGIELDAPRHRVRSELSPAERAFMNYEAELCDLLRAVELVQLAQAADEDGTIEGGVSVAPIALEHLKERAVRLKKDWYETHTRLFKQ
jgi:hypothetical protein